MRLHPAPSLSSRRRLRHPPLNGKTGRGQHESDIGGAAIDEEGFWVNELQLLADKVEQLSAANRRKDEFLAVLSHELSSPLASIQHGIGVLRGRKGDDETVRRGMYELIDRQLRQIAQLASGLFDVGRITSGQLLLRRETTDLHAVLAKAIETVEPEFARRHQLLAPAWDATGIRLMADPSRLEQVFVNLLVNASKYTDPGGQIALLMSTQGRYAVVRIKDSGIGIAAQELPHIFDLYARVEAAAAQSRSGLGIGLALVRSIVQLHDGTITAASAGLGQGSEFLVRLPTETL